MNVVEPHKEVKVGPSLCAGIQILCVANKGNGAVLDNVLNDAVAHGAGKQHTRQVVQAAATENGKGGGQRRWSWWPLVMVRRMRGSGRGDEEHRSKMAGQSS